MLRMPDVEFIRRNFNVYEHNWRLYSALLGSVVLVEDVLIYCDGSGLYVSLFSLREPGKTFSRDSVMRIVTSAMGVFNDANIQFIDVWGRFQDLSDSSIGGRGLFKIVSQSEYYVDGFDSIFNVLDFAKSPSSHGRRRMRSAAARGVTVDVVQRQRLTYKHLGIIEAWLLLHPDVSKVHREFMFSLSACLIDENTHICEATHNGTLVGLLVFSVVSSDRIVVLNSFPLRNPGMRVGDALFSGVVLFAEQKEVQFIHRGYSATPSLVYAKESWGSCSRSKPYRETFFSLSSDFAELIKTGNFLWRLRLG